MQNTNFTPNTIFFVVSFLTVFLTYLFVLPKLPGVTFKRLPLLTASVTGVLQTITTTLLSATIGYAAFLSGFFAKIDGNAASSGILWFWAGAAAFVALVSALISLIIIFITAMLPDSPDFELGAPRVTAAAVLTVMQIGACAACLTILVLTITYTKYGFIDKNGHFVIPPTYEQVHNFRHGFAKVYLHLDHVNQKADEPFFIDRSGARVMPPRQVVLDEEEPSISPDFIVIKGENYLPFSENLAAKQHEPNANWCFVNRQFKVVTPVIFREVRFFSEGLAAVAVRLDESGELTDHHNAPQLWGYINHKGQWIIKPKFTSASSFNDGLACVKIETQTKDGKKGVGTGWIDKKGSFVIPLGKFGDGQTFSEGLAAAAPSTESELVEPVVKERQIPHKDDDY